MKSPRTEFCIALCALVALSGLAGPSYAAADEPQPTYMRCGALWIANIRSVRDFESSVPLEKSFRPNSELLYGVAEERGIDTAYFAVAHEYNKCAENVRQAGNDRTSGYRACATMSLVLVGTIDRLSKGEPLGDILGAAPSNFHEPMNTIGARYENSSKLLAMKDVATGVERCLREQSPS